MNVLLSGATGVLGRRLTGLLSDEGHAVYGLARNEQGAAVVESNGGIAVQGDVLERETLADSLADREVDTLLHAATAIPTPDEEADWERNDRVRVDGAKNLLAATADHDLTQVVFPSVVWVTRQPDGSPFDESSPRHPTVATESAAEVEDLLQSAASRRGFETSILRLGFLYAADAAHTRYFGRTLLGRDLPVAGGGLLGRRDAEFSMLHADDGARALAAAVEAGDGGLWHVVDDERVTVATFFETLAELLDAPSPRRVPGWLVRLVEDGQTAQFMTTSMPTTNAAFKQAFDWEPVVPTYREGLEQVVETWKSEGTLRETDERYEWIEQSDPGRGTDAPSTRTQPA